MNILADKIVIITGAGSGLGRAIALRFLAEGAYVVGVGRDQAKLDTLAQEFGDPDRLLTMSRDVSRPDLVQQIIEATIDRFGRIDALVNNAATSTEFNKRLHETSIDRWDDIIAVNLRGYYLMMRAVLGQMVAQKSGSILNISSIGGLEGAATIKAGAYGISKAGIIQLSRTAAIEYAGDNIRVNCLCPGTIDTPRLKYAPTEMLDKIRNLIPMQRFGTADEMTGAALFLVSDDASFCTGSTFLADGGFLAGKVTG